MTKKQERVLLLLASLSGRGRNVQWCHLISSCRPFSPIHLPLTNEITHRQEDCRLFSKEQWQWRWCCHDHQIYLRQSSCRQFINTLGLLICALSRFFWGLTRRRRVKESSFFPGAKDSRRVWGEPRTHPSRDRGQRMKGMSLLFIEIVWHLVPIWLCSQNNLNHVTRESSLIRHGPFNHHHIIVSTLPRNCWQ